MGDSNGNQRNGLEGLGIEPSETPAYKDLSDDVLMSLVRDTDDELAYNELSSRHRQETLLFFLVKIRNRATADDLTQDVWIRIWASRKKFRAEGVFKAWLWWLTRNTWYDYLRRTGGRPEDPLDDLHPILSSDQGIENQILAKELNVKFHKAWKRLPPGERELLKLRYFDDLTLQEIAAHCKVSAKTVSTWLKKAREDFREVLRLEYGDAMPKSSLLAKCLEECLLQESLLDKPAAGEQRDRSVVQDISEIEGDSSE